MSEPTTQPERPVDPPKCPMCDGPMEPVPIHGGFLGLVDMLAGPGRAWRCPAEHAIHADDEAMPGKQKGAGR